jgi:hypothetical protein
MAGGGGGAGPPDTCTRTISAVKNNTNAEKSTKVNQSKRQTKVLHTFSLHHNPLTSLEFTRRINVVLLDHLVQREKQRHERLCAAVLEVNLERSRSQESTAGQLINNHNKILTKVELREERERER